MGFGWSNPLLCLVSSKKVCKGFLAIRRVISLNETFVYFLEIRTGDTRHTMVEQKTGKSRLFKAEPLPICKMENDRMNDMARC